ncbi:MAG: 5-methyltetrahydropteroyltriglutamate--homocysteine S-methyltransferase [Lachnospiraceae bacterium]|nr:5-methyltetrahydropteroyltriglutamate--homocysteine S-methyltransferase [Lachnospiraceae bacterium]
MQSAVIGFPRVGKLRELKFACEKYFRGEVEKEDLWKEAAKLRKEHWEWQQSFGIQYISSNDFSFYDNMLDAAVLLNAVPECYRKLKLNETDTYFAMARGYQGEAGDVPALAMKKWFNTNYHYIVPEIGADTQIRLNGSKPFEEYREARCLGIQTKSVLIGAFTFLKLAKYQDNKTPDDYVDAMVSGYRAVLEKFRTLGAEWVQLDEPALVTDLTKEDICLFETLYKQILAGKGKLKVLLQTYFGDIRDCYRNVAALDFDGIGLDFLEGKKTKDLVETYGFPEDKVLFAGLVNGKNIWRCNYRETLEVLWEIKKYTPQIVLSTSCSLLHVPYTLGSECSMKAEVKQHFSFALEKLQELQELSVLTECDDYKAQKEYVDNRRLFEQERPFVHAEAKQRAAALSEKDFIRQPERAERQRLQKKAFGLPLLPTTTIGSLPQTQEVKRNRSSYRRGEIDKSTYDSQVYAFIKECIEKQEQIGLDVLVHGEYERNDMVEFFGENLSGYVFTDKAWVQSYGTRCVKPPIIFGDVMRIAPITVDYSVYAQSLTERPVKGMLTGPVTILNWSFPREDISLKEMAYQIGIAVREEVLDLERAGIRMIQIDEAALKEKLPIRRSDWYSGYLDWAIPAFRLCHSGVKPETQIHTHMCYSEFDDIIREIDDMDADVISFEASRSKLTILDAIRENHFETEVGPGVYDIHSPRVPSVEEIVTALRIMLTKISKEKLWVNPDCGLKTRGMPETEASLRNLVEAAGIVREEL